jgi:ATP-dependent Clp protease ATP-binding subunit ClpA
MLNHSYIGTEHLLLGLINEPDTAAGRVLVGASLDLRGMRDRVREIIGEGQTAPSGHIPFTPRMKKIFELSLREAVQLGHHDIGTEHLLLGLLRDGEGIAVQVLAQQGVDLERTREAVIRAAGSDPEPSRSLRRPSLLPSNCIHPDNELTVTKLDIGIRTVRCQLCKRLVATLPDS